MLPTWLPVSSHKTSSPLNIFWNKCEKEKSWITQDKIITRPSLGRAKTELECEFSNCEEVAGKATDECELVKKETMQITDGVLQTQSSIAVAEARRKI